MIDQFFTPPATAQACWAWLQDRLPGAVDDYFYCEPSVGRGAFYDLLPAERRAGFELDPELAGRINIGPVDFLAVDALPGLAPLVVVGNPPFGPRGKLAVRFINKAFELGADYVAMILPAAFRPAMAVPASCDSYIEVRRIIPSTSDKACGLQHLGKCDLYMQLSCYNRDPKGFRFWRTDGADDFVSENKSGGYGIKIHKHKEKITALLTGANWKAVAAKSAGEQRTLSIDIIKQAVIAGGFIDGGGEPGEPTLQPPAIERRIVAGRSVGYVDLDDDAFELPDGKAKRIPNCAFVLYKRGTRPRGDLFEPRRPSCKSYVKLYHLQYGGGIAKHNERNAGRDRDCDVFIPQCLYRSSDAKASTSKDWNQCIGVKILRGGSRLRDYLLGYDWTREGRCSPTGQNHITRPIVHDVIVAGGFIDDDGEPTLQPSCNSYIRLYNITSNGGGRALDKIQRCDLLLARTNRYGSVQKHGVPIVEGDELPNSESIGIEILRDHARLKRHLLGYNWEQVGRGSSNENVYFTQAAVRHAVIAGGFTD